MAYFLLTVGFIAAFKQEVPASNKEDSLNKSEQYEGHWRFVKEDFSKRHPFWPNYFIKKALKTRLYLSKDKFIQYKDPNTLHGKPKDIISIVEKKDNHWEFKRKDSDNIVLFTLTKKNGIWIYREGKKEYQLKKDSPDLHLKWKNDK